MNYTLYVLVVSSLTLTVYSQSYRTYPSLSNLVREQNVTTSPSDSSCGFPTRSTYCRSTTLSNSVSNCFEEFCDQACPLRYELPLYADLLDVPNFGVCATMDTINLGTDLTSYSVIFLEETGCYLAPTDRLQVGADGELTLTFWMRQTTGNTGTVLDKVTNDGVSILSLSVSSQGISLQYSTAEGVLRKEMVDVFIPPLTWTHIAIQIYDRFINLFIDGTEFGSRPVVAGLLEGVLVDKEGVLRVGQRVNGTGQYVGRLQDFRAYSWTLSNREIEEVMTGILPELHAQSTCRCPGSHPRVRPSFNRYCIKNGMGDDSSMDQVLRLGTNAHPLQYINDGDTNSIWISSQTEEVSVSVDLGDSFQVFFVVMQFYSPLPKAVTIERQLADSTWQPWQYYAEDCMTYFGLENNGALENSSSVNCLRLPSQDSNILPYSRGNITFSILSQAPVPRPGHNDFYNTPDLYSFVLANSVRVNLSGHYYVQNSKHQYFGVYEFIVTGRCDCNGHAETCDTSRRPYQCQCDSESYTQGSQCSSCLPLYNDKPFRVGDQINAYPCKPCNCFDHADSCVYNSSLDLYPEDYQRGGGGQCVNCRDNTKGIHCEACIELHYRDPNLEFTSPGICLACDCDRAGTVDGTDQCDLNGGQCPCKENVEGRRCDRCKPGTYSLLSANPLGCSPCMCHIDGVKDGDMNCDSDGVCSCKDNVRGDKCSLCDYGFYNLTSSNPQGCTACSCDSSGSSSLFCNPTSGECQCKTNVQGSRCQECVDGFWDIERSCIPCAAHCNENGIVTGSSCDKATGQCVCKPNVHGLGCNECKPSYHSFGSSQSLGCIACNCNPSGSVNSSSLCDQSSGQCDCKENVVGATCSECRAYTYGLTADNALGCTQCDCDPSGTVGGEALPVDQLPCDQNNGSCACLTYRAGRRCDTCEPMFYLNPFGAGCLLCNCHPEAAVNGICDINTGQCSCKDDVSGVKGQRCDECIAGYFAFDGVSGSCSPCECSLAGSTNNTCDDITGQCTCKEFVQGRACDECVEGAVALSADNPYGCNKFPAQQPAPTYRPISSTVLEISWLPPDYPNGVIDKYVLIRDGLAIANLTHSEFSYNDTDLTPYTLYKYKVQSHNPFGYAESDEVSFRTLAGAPSGDLVLNVSNLLPYSADFSWTPVSNTTGAIEKYILTYTTDVDPETTVVLYEGKEVASSSDQLSPYTNYSFVVTACTAGGCLTSQPVWLITPLASPSGQDDPVVTPVSSDSFYIEWQPPAHPNGIIIYYELWMKGELQADGTVDPPLRLIFNPSGQYNPRSIGIEENALPPPATNYTVTSLQPFTYYEFQVLSQNDISKTASNWVKARTLEAAPESTPAPTITALSSSALIVQWAEPSIAQINGLVTIYRLLQVFNTDPVTHPFDPPTFTQEIYSSRDVREYTVTDLPPYSTNKFIVQVCNSVGCVDSEAVTALTLPAAPSSPRDPVVISLNATSLLLTWEEPADLNGPPPSYSVMQSPVSFSVPSPRVEEGKRCSGGGYYIFPSNTLPQNVPFTGFSLWFRTTQSEGLILLLTSAGNQEEFVLVQMKDGLPWFLFDPQGCVITVGIDTQGDFNLSYSDGLWHHMEVSRDGTAGTLALDGTMTGHVQGDCATGTIIGGNTGVYIGGLPKDFVFTNEDLRLQVTRQSFTGCIKDVQLLTQATPREIWTRLDWSSAIAKKDSYPEWYGCPSALEPLSAHFQGQGWLELSTPMHLQNSSSIDIELSLRTEYTDGLLFVIFDNEEFFYAMVSQGAVVLTYENFSVALTLSELNVCGGQWSPLKLVKTESQLSISTAGYHKVINISTIRTGFKLSPSIYLGGLPPNSKASQMAMTYKLDLSTPFSGCFANLSINSRPIDMHRFMRSYMAINFDGCPSTQSLSEVCRPAPETMLLASNKNINSSYVYGLRPFTEYLYQIMASNSAGSSHTDWLMGVTREAPPSGVQAPYYAEATSGYTIDVGWIHPSGSTGLVYMYILRAYDQLRANEVIEMTFYGSNMLTGVLNKTRPHTNYTIHLEACTAGGCTESTSGIYVKTLEERPEGVQPPFVISNGPTYIYIGLLDPVYPNGVITGYELYFGVVLLYNGTGMSYNYTNLQPFSVYEVKMVACTFVGCTESETVGLLTAQLAPAFVLPPQLIVYGTRRIDAMWLEPENIQGHVTRYLVYMSTSDLGLPGDLVYNSSDVGFRSYRNESLMAGTTYYYTLRVCTEGGCTLSEAANASTVESSPDLVQDPVVTPISAYSLHVSWLPPLQPNGIITKYSLIHNSVMVYETVDELMYNATSLLPYSIHTFQLQVCTAQGCTLSNEVSSRTLEDAPQGSVTVEVRPVTEPREVTVRWTRAGADNGLMTYSVYFEGLYYLNSVTGDYSTVRQRRELYNTSSTDVWVTIDGLIPYSQYQLQVNASNSIGFLLSNQISVSMPAGAPDGVMPPMLTAVNSTAITAAWEPPGRLNAPDVAGVLYQLHFRADDMPSQEAFSQPSAATTFTLLGLQPYKNYSFRLEAVNEAGSSLSDWATVQTLQAPPESIDPPLVLGIASRSVTLAWSEPAQANGVVLTYNIYSNGSLVLSVHSAVNSTDISELFPYSTYIFMVEVCTVAGCVSSAPSQPIRTLEDAPEGLAPPTVVSLTATSVEVSWKKPTQANGVLLQYTVERWVSNSSSLVLFTIGPTQELVYLDEGDDLHPYTQYRYRISASTGGGTTFSDWADVTTKSAQPSGLAAPLVEVLNASAVRVAWESPLKSNGPLNRYEVRYGNDLLTIMETDVREIILSELTPYTHYNISIIACTDGGCTESNPVLVRTNGARPGGLMAPKPIVLSQTFIAVQWEEVQYPNGPGVRYSLTRVKVAQPLATEPVGIDLWVEVYSGPGLYYEDRGLSLYTTYAYRLTAYNDYGFLTSDTSPAVVTHSGQPFEAPVLTVTVVSHTTLKADWTIPDVTVLQGAVESFSLLVNNMTYTYGSEITSATIDTLTPNSDYTFTLTLYVYGGLFISTEPVKQRTADGVPQGVAPPQLFVVSDTAIRVAWVEPLQPNGEIISYYLYLNGMRLTEVNSSEPGSHVIEGLQPYTVYEFMLEVCTVYACVNSSSIQGTTAESQPQGLALPDLQVLSATEVEISWTEPMLANDPDDSLGLDKCDYVECTALQTFCGGACYNGSTICCNGVAHTPIDGFTCCGTAYIQAGNSADDVCCGGIFYTKADKFECCYGRYVEVPEDHICCADGDRLNIGYGDYCCGSIPYSSVGAQLCCQGTLHESFEQQCCGDAVVSLDSVCCGDEATGLSYTKEEGKTCCGIEYVPEDRTSCCRSSLGFYKAHSYSSSEEMVAAGEICCELALIQRSEACCNGRGYDPSLQVCADVGDSSDGCGSGTICPLGSSAHCDKCDFNSSISCYAVSSQVDASVNDNLKPPASDSICRTEPVLIYSGLRLSTRDVELFPWSTYEYSLSATNRAGMASTNYQSVRTAQSVPAGLAPPLATLIEGNLYVIRLDWVPPLYPNGEIVQYSLWRSTGGQAVEIHRGLELTYLDSTNVQPFVTYTYVLRACTVVGCIQSEPVDVATQQAPPSQVSPPTIASYNATAVFLVWTHPGVANGIIQRYIIYDTLTGFNISLDTLELIITGLKPYSDHLYILSACTEAACTNSTATSVTTQQALPQGVPSPGSVIISNKALIIIWSAPTQPNGLITEYRLYRAEDGYSMLVYAGYSLTYTDSSLTPGSTYYYVVEVVNGAGSVNSSSHSVTLPISAPQGLATPTLAQALSPYTIEVEWAVLLDSPIIISQYQVVLNAGSLDELTVSVVAGSQVQRLSYNVSGLTPYTLYSVRIGACFQDVNNSCVRGPAVYVTTLEAVAVNLSAPVLAPLPPDSVRITWKPPELANGVIESYIVMRRFQGSESMIIFVGDNVTFLTVDADSELQPYLQYEYRVGVTNGAGETMSQWASVTTPEAPPTAPTLTTVSPLGPYSLRMSWTPPIQPNGILSKYIVEYQETSQEPTFSFPIKTLNLPATFISTTFSGLSAYTVYRVRVVAVNSAGSASSAWTQARTLESTPDGIRLLEWQPRENGRSILLSWLAPEKANGQIVEYILKELDAEYPLYRGLDTEFVYLRLQPYTNYTLRLEVCTTAGCTQGPWQIVTTAETLPDNQPIPTLGSVESTRVTLRWGPPLNPYGRITKYKVLRLSMGRLAKRETFPTIVYFTNDTMLKMYEYIDEGLLPFSSYHYRIRSSNSKGHVESDWLEVETDESAPAGVLPPTISHYGSSFDKLLITWNEPITSNGIIKSYQLTRDEETPWSFGASDIKEYIDSGLSPYTNYSYKVAACTSAGCTFSMRESILTKESSPLSVEAPLIIALSSSELEVTWNLPDQLNGVLLQFDLYVNSQLVYSGLQISFLISGLSPYTQYRVVIQACTAGGCTSSPLTLGQTLADVPRGMVAPILRVVSSTAVEISWSQPSQPNGIVHSYTVTRDGVTVYTGEGFVYTDTGLQPDTRYTYTVTANNTAGVVVSPESTASTYMSSPEGLLSPTLVALSSTSIQAVWLPPATPNGVITNYTLYDDFNRNILFSGLQFSATITGLEYYTTYSIRLQACTLVGCALSLSSVIRTLEAPPSGLERPTVTPQSTVTGAHAAILVVWEPPRRLNGELLGYRLYRREVLIANGAGEGYSESVMVYNGTERRFLDLDMSLKPYSLYEYELRVDNSAGSASSDWSRVRTYPGTPSGLSAPDVLVINPRSITVKLHPPAVPNGEIVSYALSVNGTTMTTEGVGLEFTVLDLSPHTVYNLNYKACTEVACAWSPHILATTSPDLPLGMSVPFIDNVTSYSAFIQWSAPSHPNGVLTGYQLYQRLGCPKAYQPFHTQPCVRSQPTVIGYVLVNETSIIVVDLLPYTSYEWKVEASNSVGVTESDKWSSVFSTLPSDPEYISVPGVKWVTSANDVMLDWSGAFLLHGQLIRYELYTKDLSVEEARFLRRYSGYATEDIIQLTAQQVLDVYVSVVTTEGLISSPTLRLEVNSVGLVTTTSSPATGTTASQGTAIPLAFWLVPTIVIAVILLSIIFFLLVRYCVRGRRQPYLREKTPLPKRQYRQGDTILPKSLSLTPIESFHDVLSAQNGTVTSAPLNHNVGTQSEMPPESQSSLSLQSSVATRDTPQGLRYTRLSPNAMSLPYAGYSNGAYVPEAADMQRGATIWPVDPSLSSSVPYELEQELILDQSSPKAGTRSVISSHRSVISGHRSVTPALRSATPRQVLEEGSAPRETYIGKLSPGHFPAGSLRKESGSTSNSDEDAWDDSVLQESGMFDDSEFSSSDVEFPFQQTSFTDTHL